MNTTTKANVLIVEDSLAAAKRLQISLEQAGFSVEIARNGQQAWKKAQRQRFELVITDEQMPIMSGRQLCRRLRADDRYADIPIIFLTAADFATDSAGLDEDLGISATFGKPFNPATLVRTVEVELSAAGRARRKLQRQSVRPKCADADTSGVAVAHSCDAGHRHQLRSDVEDLLREVRHLRQSIEETRGQLTDQSGSA
jgi:DNA-binding response OmpR family regulator